ncbi:hypothetical protein HC175_13800 [Salinimicrobium sp. CDJ15-91]|uniref:Cardiolipin synthase N-terminal domain-containing protein n=1 Tax=Salinimicrobium oceani TaxID=2722702 RepID=A0ABX1D0E8_9FLAO|nr:hypothetical protein [Salinimicrobium oceani]
MVKHLIKFRVPVSILFFACQFLWIRADGNLLNWQLLSFSAAFSFFILFSFWFVLLFDMINTKIQNKTFWLISMLVMPWLAPSVYLFQRKKLHSVKSLPAEKQ